MEILPLIPLRSQRLFIMRHAASAPGKPDKERSLSFEGRKQLGDLSHRALGLFDHVTHVLCSTANRTQQTYTGIKRILPIQATPFFLNSLYLASAAIILEEITLISKRADDILVIGHNPGVSEFLAQSTNSSSSSPMAAAQIAIYDVISPFNEKNINFTDYKLRDII